MSRDLRRQAWFTVLAAAVSAVASMAVCAAAILVPAPVSVGPALACCSVGVPMLMAFRLAPALALLRAGHGFEPASERDLDDPALVRFRRFLADLPEVEHPLGR